MHYFFKSLGLGAVLAAAPMFAAAQEVDSVFDDYASYAAFVDETVSSRDFKGLILRLGGRDEYTNEQLNGLQNQFLGIYSQDFTESSVLGAHDLGSGFSTEIRSYWGDAGYVWFGAMLHDRGDSLVVINFRVNSNPQAVMEAYAF